MPFGKKQNKALRKAKHVHKFDNYIRERIELKPGLGLKGKRVVHKVYGCDCGRTIEV